MTLEIGYRNLNEWEKQFIWRLLSVEFPGRGEIAEQLRHSLVKTIDQEGSLSFEIQNEVVAPVEKRIPVEAEAKDTDGQIVHALLHVVQGRATELEIYRDDGSPPRHLPDPQDWEILVLPKPSLTGWLRPRPQ